MKKYNNIKSHINIITYTGEVIMKQFLKLLSILLILISISSSPIFAASSMTQTVTVNIPESIGIASSWNGGGNSSTISFGDLAADNIEKSWPGGVTGEQLQTLSNVGVDIYVRASGNFLDSDTGETIPLSNLYSAGYGDSKAKTQLSTGYVNVVDSWARPVSGETKIVPVDLYLTVPFGTKSGTYTTTLYYTAVKSGTLGPA